LWENLQQNQTPILLLVGEYDTKFITINSEMAQLCKSAKLEIIGNCGHNIHWGNPPAFVENIEKFLS
jgi:2-succinyl-6-hydroxy-2,4-cyclohexadiene-1-carboxylate synthase